MINRKLEERQSKGTGLPHSLEADLEKTLVSASKSFKAVHLRLLMKERDAVVKQFTDLDNEISAIENYFLGASSD